MEYYRIVLAFHIIAVIAWMAGILYLYRLLVYSTEQGTEKKDVYELLKTMNRRLLKVITLPAMMVAWTLGLTLIAINPTIMKSPWVHIKLTLVVILTISTSYASMLVRRYQAGTKPLPSSRNLRILNEVPTLLMIAIVLLAILKPVIG